MSIIELLLVVAMVVGVYFVARPIPVHWRVFIGVPLLGIAIVALLIEGRYPHAAFLSALLVYGGYVALREWRSGSEESQAQ